MKFSTTLAATAALLTGANAVIPYQTIHYTDICWKVCFPEKPHCPGGWHDKKFGHCYTCCKDTDDDDDDDDKVFAQIWNA
ncbi:hypothetical protein BDV25DRAFT_147473 [Aspergillus avenaceus]|uniref:Uncharacterized protein n=1 Tax=Aspergillus avenaceus TaxID=36643 RepID=A0A5N6U7E9_ASPAV|nr:hypothetical protein BDV25DRAFT_147473 [Aspergillus avenaceus]